MSESKADDFKAIIKGLLNGDYPLSQTFWLYYFVAVLVTRFIGGTIGGPIGAIISVVALLWAGFMVIPIWKSADNYDGNSLFALLAKIAAVLIGLTVFATIS